MKNNKSYMKGNADADKILTIANQLYQNEHKHKIGMRLRYSCR